MDQITELIKGITEIELVRETHLSRVYISANYVFKIKKPFNLGFADFSSIQSRIKAAALEIRLNRRLSRDVYLGCLLLSRIDDTLQLAPFSLIDLDAVDRNIESATNLNNILKDLLSVSVSTTSNANIYEIILVMRRLSEDRNFEQIIRTQKVGIDEHIAPLVDLICVFHRQNRLEVAAAVDSLISFDRQMSDNFFTLHSCTFNKLHYPELIRALLNRIKVLYEMLRDSFEALLKIRAQSSSLVDGHGDLRAEHIYFETIEQNQLQIRIIDCLEFSEEMRQIDPLSDVAFLSMDLDYLHRADLSKALEVEYLLKSDEQPGYLKLFRIYKIFRAMIRAKVHAIRAGQLENSGEREQQESLATSYLGLAHRYVVNVTGPLIIIVMGLSGTGKSTSAGMLRSMLHASLLSSDIIRRELFGSDSRRRSFSYGEDLYAQELRNEVYDEMLHRAKKLLNHGEIVVLDATFGRRSDRARVASIAEASKSLCIFIECKLPRRIALERLARRLRDYDNISDAREQIYEEQIKQWEEVLPKEASAYHGIETTSDIFSIIEQLIDSMAFGAPHSR